ncbi:MAG: molybdopterin-dependent oxidoreductase, partial [Desulfovibrio sp.]|nr:molybdopterin-dependent oxidoreductase [Desulfovibrio sp.]
MNTTRREFLRYFAMACAAAAASGTGLPKLAYGASDKPEKWVKGVCRYCGTGFGVVIGVKDGKAIAIQGDPNNHNAGLLCLKGSMLIPVLNSKERVTKPMIRRTKGGPLEAISWDEALDTMAKKFRDSIDKHGPDSVAWYGSGQCLTEETYVANKLFKGGFGTNNVDGNPRLCMASAVGGYLTSFGKDEPMGTYGDIDNANCFFIIGSNTSEAHPVLFRRIARRKQTEPSVKIIVADPRRTNTARIADLHIPFRPGTDLALMNAMAWVIINEELDNPRFWQKYVNFMTPDGKPADFEAYKEFLEDYRPEKVAEICKVPEKDIREAARMFAESPAAMSLWCMGINQRVQGVAANNLIHNLHLLTGQIGRPGATPFSLTGQPNACGGVRDGGALSHLLPAGRVVANPKHRAEMEKIWGLPEGRISDKNGYHTVALFEALGSGDVKCLIICET